jgi:hypothetical protein
VTEVSLRSRAVSIDQAKLNELAGVDFDLNDVVELAELAAIYVHRFDQSEVVPNWLAAEIWTSDAAQRPRKASRDARRAFVEAVEGIWRQRKRARGYGSHYDNDAKTHYGPLIALIQELFRAAGEERPPMNTTLHHDLVFLYTARERAGHGPAESRKPT